MIFPITIHFEVESRLDCCIVVEEKGRDRRGWDRKGVEEKGRGGEGKEKGRGREGKGGEKFI